MNHSATTDPRNVSLSQGQKTAIFGAVALLAMLLALEPWRISAKTDDEPIGVVKLFPKFEKAAQATGIQIVKFDEETGAVRTFSVKLQNDRWVIPSHEDYPADATQHMGEAAVSVLDLKSIAMVSNRPGDFQTYGVVAPDPAKLKAGDTGIGEQVTFRGANDSILADMIIGKSRARSNPTCAMCALAGHDQVYQVMLKTDKLSTRFSEWIEKDLLKINAFDIREVQLNDYSLDEGIGQDGQPAIAMVRRGKIKLDYDDEKSKWNLAELIEYKNRKEIQGKLGDDEELNTEKLNAMRNALDDLKIVDVQRKPAGLSRDLRVTDAFVKDREAALSLQKKGFYAFAGEEGQTEILSTEGEVLAFVKDGVEYTLRFGEPTVAGADEEKEDPKTAAPGEDKSKTSRLNRYLFISCQFREDRIPKPELKELPPAGGEQPPAASEPKKEEPAEKTDATSKPDSPAAPESPAKPDDGAKPGDAGKPDASDKQGAKPRRNIFHLTADEKPAAKAAPDSSDSAAPSLSPAGEAKPADAPTADAPVSDAKPAETKPGDAKPGETKPGEMPAEGGEEAGGQTRAKAREAKAEADLRTAIEKENKRQQSEYDEKITKGREHVKQLNDRFADWYYVISDEVYHKIHLSRADVIKKKTKEPGKGDGLGDLDALQKLGPGGHMHGDHDHDHDHK